MDIVLTHFQSTNTPIPVFGFEDLASELYDAIGYGFATKLAYGIGIVRKERLRVWAGPSIRLNANYIDQKKTSVQELGLEVEVDPWGVIMSAGGGVEGGVRYDVSRELTLDFSTGFHYNFFGSYQDLNLKVEGLSLGSDESFLSGEEPFFFVQIALGFDFSQDEASP
jgi:hypothetical protein